jgi:hypothetical protein
VRVGRGSAAYGESPKVGSARFVAGSVRVQVDWFGLLSSGRPHVGQSISSKSVSRAR